MAEILKLRVILDIEEPVFRDIEIKSEDVFLSLHKKIQEAFAFDSSEMASFFMSNDNWDKGEEVTLMKMDFDDGSSSGEMKDVLINSLISETGEKMVYVFDFMLMWCFYVEVIDILPVDVNKSYPIISHSFGTAPNQYSKEVTISVSDDKHMLKNKPSTKFSMDALDDFGDPDDLGSEFEELPDDIY